MSGARRQAQRCTARSKRTGEPCQAYAIEGGTICAAHGGRAPQVKRKAAERLEPAAAEQAVVTYGLPREIDPWQALLDEIARAQGHVDWLEAQIRQVAPDELVRGEHQVRLTLYQEQRAHLVRVNRAALAAGLADRQVRLAETQGHLIAQVLRSVIADLDLPASKAAEVPPIAGWVAGARWRV